MSPISNQCFSLPTVSEISLWPSYCIFTFTSWNDQYALAVLILGPTNELLKLGLLNRLLHSCTFPPIESTTIAFGYIRGHPPWRENKSPPPLTKMMDEVRLMSWQVYLSVSSNFYYIQLSSLPLIFLYDKQHFVTHTYPFCIKPKTFYY